MSSKAARSGQLLEQLWSRFTASYAADFPGTKALSKRTVSDWLTADTHALARWTNDAAHQAGHPEWRIPLRRVPEVCLVLRATSDERDELMLARLQEIQESEEKSDVMVLMHWLTPTIIELADRPVLDAHERQVLAAFGRACAATPGADHVPAPLPLDDKLEAFLQKWMTRAVSEYANELDADTVADDAAGASRPSERAKQVMAGLAKRRAALKPSAPSKREMQAVVRQFRQAIRKTAKNPEAG